MKIDKYLLYILIEGQPNSPEVPFFHRAINKLISQRDLPSISYDIIEVGGNRNFNSIARMIYKVGGLYKIMPVIAITDKDYRTQNEVNDEDRISDSELIQKKIVKKIYWERHEWENFLLEETEVIANLLNWIPLSPAINRKPFKRNSIDLTKQQLDRWLLDYFKSQVVNELIECLRFGFIQKANRYLKLDDNLSPLLPDVNPWFKSQLVKQAKISRKNIFDLKSMPDSILQEDDWKLFISLCVDKSNNMDYEQAEVFFQQAKIFFRGKEALKNLFNTDCKQYLSIEHLSYDTFISSFVLPELEKNINSVIIQELKSMLHPYFQTCGEFLKRKIS